MKPSSALHFHVPERPLPHASYFCPGCSRNCRYMHFFYDTRNSPEIMAPAN